MQVSRVKQVLYESNRHTRRNGDTLAHKPYTQRHPQPAGAELCGQACYRAFWRGDGQTLSPAARSRHFHLDISLSAFTWVCLGFLKKKKKTRERKYFFSPSESKTSLGISAFLMCVCVHEHSCFCLGSGYGGELKGEGSCC